MSVTVITRLGGMGRWQPEPQRRLREAAMALYAERGLEQTTVAEIAALAGVTERTFFRYFADKREVLFSGTEALLAAALAAVRAAPAGTPAIDVAAAGLEAAAATLPDQDYARARQAVITANPGLQERELLKMSTLSASIAEALVERGEAPHLAALVASLGVSAFGVSFERWASGAEGGDYADAVRASFAQLKAAVAG